MEVLVHGVDRTIMNQPRPLPTRQISDGFEKPFEIRGPVDRSVPSASADSTTATLRRLFCVHDAESGWFLIAKFLFPKKFVRFTRFSHPGT